MSPKKIFYVLLLVVSVAPLAVLAATTIDINISPNLPGTNSSNSGVSGFVANFYGFALAIAGILAFGAIVYGGIKYAAGSGNPSSQSEGKSWIQGALLGLLLLAGAYIVLHTINPDIVSLQLPGLPGAPTVAPTAPSGGGAPTPLAGACPMTPLATITDPQALAMENGQSVVWNSSDSNVQKNLDAIAVELSKMKTVLAKPGIGDTVTPTSVYRPLAYQAHFYDIYQHATDYQYHPNYSSIPNCTSIIANLQAEETKHGICYGSHPCLVAAPSGCSPHVRGIAIDLILSGPIGYSAVNPILSANNVGLVWKALPNDKPHFQLVNPPFSGCASS